MQQSGSRSVNRIVGGKSLHLHSLLLPVFGSFWWSADSLNWTGLIVLRSPVCAMFVHQVCAWCQVFTCFYTRKLLLDQNPKVEKKKKNLQFERRVKTIRHLKYTVSLFFHVSSSRNLFLWCWRLWTTTTTRRNQVRTSSCFCHLLNLTACGGIVRSMRLQSHDWDWSLLNLIGRSRIVPVCLAKAKGALIVIWCDINETSTVLNITCGPKPQQNYMPSWLGFCGLD